MQAFVDHTAQMTWVRDRWSDDHEGTVLKLASSTQKGSERYRTFQLSTVTDSGDNLQTQTITKVIILQIPDFLKNIL